jgi:hypothetical protein
MKIKTWIEGVDEIHNVAYTIYYNYKINKKEYEIVLNPSTFVYFSKFEFKLKPFYDAARIYLRVLKIKRLKEKC